MRGRLMAWAFEEYATGEWSLRSLLAELTRRGLNTAVLHMRRPPEAAYTMPAEGRAY